MGDIVADLAFLLILKGDQTCELDPLELGKDFRDLTPSLPERHIDFRARRLDIFEVNQTDVGSELANGVYRVESTRDARAGHRSG